MLALNRYSGSGALFLTLAPASWKYGLFYRFANPMQHNSGSIVGDDVTIPVTNNQRKALKLASPYGDVRMYVTLVNSIIKNIIGIPVDNAMNSRSLKPIVPVHCRPRGLLGQVAHFYAANETSAEGILHTHLKLYNTLPWDLLESIAENAAKNKQFGMYMDTIICNELSSARIFDRIPKPPFPDPTVIYINNGNVPIPTSTTRPNDASDDEFWNVYEPMAYTIQYHGNHNFSCWKNGSALCRFKLPAASWNQLSGLIQLEEIVENGRKVVKVKTDNGPPVEAAGLFDVDKRCLIFYGTKRTTDGAVIRDPTVPSAILDASAMIELEISDEGRHNGLMSPCSPVILVCCGGGGGLHNNLQHVHKSGMGENSYIAKYIGKGIGKLCEILPLMYEVLQSNRTSVAADASTNPNRPALFTLQRAVNLKHKMQENSLPLMLASLLQVSQFYSSTEYQYVPASAFRKCQLDISSDELGGAIVQEEDEVVAGNRSRSDEDALLLFNENDRNAHDSDNVVEEDSGHIPATLLISELLDDEHSSSSK
jgi:hypothetical protein